MSAVVLTDRARCAAGTPAEDGLTRRRGAARCAGISVIRAGMSDASSCPWTPGSWTSSASICAPAAPVRRLRRHPSSIPGVASAPPGLQNSDAHPSAPHAGFFSGFSVPQGEKHQRFRLAIAPNGQVATIGVVFTSGDYVWARPLTDEKCSRATGTPLGHLRCSAVGAHLRT
jgi:hypothetical protein